MVPPLARAAGKISIHPAKGRCDRNPAPREGPRHFCRLRPITTADDARYELVSERAMSTRRKTKSSPIMYQAGAQLYDRFLEGMKLLLSPSRSALPSRLCLLSGNRVSSIPAFLITSTYFCRN